MLAGLMLGAIAAFIIEREFMKAAAYALVAAVLSFFGFIHGAQLAWMASPMVALGYVLLGAICLAVGLSEEQAAKAGANRIGGTIIVRSPAQAPQPRRSPSMAAAPDV
jgi:adenine/guanine/hypoxanthine permease